MDLQHYEIYWSPEKASKEKYIQDELILKNCTKNVIKIDPS